MERCKSLSRAPTDRGTTVAVAQTTTAMLHRAILLLSALLQTHGHHATSLQSLLPRLTTSRSRTDHSAATPRETFPVLATLLASPAKNGHPTRRSCRRCQPSPRPTLRTRSP